MNFGALTDYIVEFLDRPGTEVRSVVQSEINQACIDTTVGHSFKILETRATTAFKVATEGPTALTEAVPYITLLPLASFAPVKNLISVSMLGETIRVPLRIVSWGQIQEWVRRERTLDKDFQVTTLDAPFYAYEIFNGLGVFPRPTKNITLQIHYDSYLKPLTNDNHSNFLLDLFSKYIQYCVLSELQSWLKSDMRGEFFLKRKEAAYTKLLEWDALRRAHEKVEGL